MTMYIYVLFAQREQRYEGQLAPEAVAVMDEYSFDENPTWLWEEQDKWNAQADIQSTRIFRIPVDQDVVSKFLGGTVEIDAGPIEPNPPTTDG